MDLRQMQAFLAVIEHGGFTAAARATHTVQSNISTHVARLERELDVTLIDRATGRTTAEGEAVLARVRRIQSELISLEADVSSMKGSPRGTVRLGVVGTTARWMVPLLVDELTSQAPDIHLMIADGTTSSLTLRILDGDLDLALIGLPHDDPEIQTTALFSEQHVVIAPDDHPLAKHEGEVSLDDLARHELLLAAPGTAFRREIDEVFAAHDLKIRAKLEVDGLRLLASLAFQGFGVAVVPVTAAPGWIGGNWTRIHVPGLPRRTVGSATRRRGMISVAAQAVLQAVTDVVQAETDTMQGLSVNVADRRS
ncbi:MAG: DNA-binding transcriptional LysR family regulator [Acidimicrobiales bacterium]|jgi:DNA-binding transcriptional LysR family regulator